METYEDYKRKRMDNTERLATMQIGMMPHLVRRLASDINTDRRKQMRGFNRDMAMIAKKFEKLYEGLIGSTNIESIQVILKNARNFEWHCSPISAARDPETCFIPVHDLSQLIQIATTTECAICAKNTGEKQRCELRKLLRAHCLEPEPSFKGDCGFVGIKINPR